MEKKFIEAYKMVTSREGTLFVYAFAYALITAVAPFLTISVVLASTFLYDVDTIIATVSHFIPADLILPFVSYIRESSPSDIVLIISVASVSFWVASKSVYSYLLESNRIDTIDIKPFVLRIIALLYFIIIVLGAIVVLLFLNYLPPYTYITVPILLWFMMMAFYRLISFKFSSFTDVYMGSAIATAGLISLGKLFLVYIYSYSNYQSIYGPLASLMILLISCYFISMIIYYGFCVNIVFYDTDKLPSTKRKLVYSLSQFSLGRSLDKLTSKGAKKKNL
jgi:membrane protein